LYVPGVITVASAVAVFYPKDYRPVAARLEAGQAINQHSADLLHFASSSTGSSARTILPVIKQVQLTIGAGDTEQTLCRRAY
jgi:hypothetical protein